MPWQTRSRYRPDASARTNRHFDFEGKYLQVNLIQFGHFQICVSRHSAHTLQLTAAGLREGREVVNMKPLMALLDYVKEDLGKMSRKVLSEPSKDSDVKQISKHGLAQHSLAAL